MGHSRLFLLVPVALCAVVLSGSGSAATPTLSATVGPGFSITLKNAAGALVTRLDRGSYLCDAHPTLLHRTVRVGAAASLLPKLSGRVGPGKAISLKRSGALVKQLPAGAYKLTVEDATKADNFHLFGSGVNKRTGVPFRGSRTWTVSFKVGMTYTYRSDAHPKLRRTFRVVGKISPPPPAVSGRAGPA